MNREPMTWRIEYDNETGPHDEGFYEWWTVSDGTRSFKCNSEDDANWLVKQLDANPIIAELRKAQMSPLGECYARVSALIHSLTRSP